MRFALHWPPSDAAAAGEHAALALSRLPVLRQDAGTAYDAITAAEERLRDLASQRVAAERSLRAARDRHAAVTQARDAHARAKPGLRTLLATRFAARREWLDRQATLDGALRDYAAAVDAARQAATAVQAQFAAALHERAEAAATLRRLTAECALALEAIRRGREQGRALPLPAKVLLRCLRRDPGRRVLAGDGLSRRENG